MAEDTKTRDLAFLRGLAERGARAPLLGGRFLCFWAGLVAIAYLLQYLVLAGHTAFGPEALAAVWTGFAVVGALGSWALGRKFPAKPGSGSIGNVVEREVWRMVALAIAFYAVGSIGAAALGETGTVIIDTIPGTAFFFYAVAFAVTGKAAEATWFRIVAAAAMGLGVVCFILIGQPFLYLFGAGGVFAVGVVPGLVLLRNEPAPVAEEA